MRLIILYYKKSMFLNTEYEPTIVDNDKINIRFKFKDLEQFYVDQINIFGNFITEEKVIRNSLIIDREIHLMECYLINQLCNKIKRNF